MSKALLVTILLFITSIVGLSGQTSGTWALTGNGNCSATGSCTGSNMAGGGGIGAISYVADGAGSNNWGEGSLAAAQTNGDYYQFDLTATDNITISSIALSTKYNNGTAGSAAVFVSVNGGAYNQVGATFTLSTTHTTRTFNTLNYGLLDNQVISVRVYAWGLSNNTKIFYTRNVVITAYTTSATDYFRSITNGNWNDVNTWESSPDGVNWYYATSYPTASASGVYINNGDTVTLTAAAACGNLTYNSGAITLGDYNLSINGTLSGTPYFNYTGSGVPSQTGTVSHVTATTTTPTSLPDTLNTLTVNPGTGNNVALPNDVTTTNLAFTAGGLDLNGNTLTLAGRDFALTSDDAVLTDLTVSLDTTTVNTYGGDSSIARTWTTTGAMSDTATVSLTYPESETAASTVKVWRRAVGDTGIWTLVGEFSVTDNGTTRTVDVTGITSLGGGTGYDWTISDIDQTLPVELSSFTAMITVQQFIRLDWVTQSETAVSGYYLYRNDTHDLASALRINAFISGTNTSQQTSYTFMDREAQTGYTYYYWLQSIDLNGEYEFHGPVSVVLPATDDYLPIIPMQTGLQQPYPNPFSGSAAISFGLVKSEKVDLIVVNVRGEVVRKLLSGTKNVGYHKVVWDGRDDNGKPVSSGVYFVKMTAGYLTSSRKLYLIK